MIRQQWNGPWCAECDTGVDAAGYGHMLTCSKRKCDAPTQGADARPAAMRAAFETLNEWPSMTPRAVFYAGWENALATRDAAPIDAQDAKLGAYVRRLHGMLGRQPEAFFDNIEAAIAASAPKETS